jgi:hypothetical protein
MQCYGIIWLLQLSILLRDFTYAYFSELDPASEVVHLQ